MACKIKLNGNELTQQQINQILQQLGNNQDFRNALMYDNYIRSTKDDGETRADTIDFLKQTFNLTNQQFLDAISKERTRRKSLGIEQDIEKGKINYVLKKGSDLMAKLPYWAGRAFSNLGKWRIYGKAGRIIKDVETVKNNTIQAFASKAFRAVERYNLAHAKVEKFLSDADKIALANIVQGASWDTMPFDKVLGDPAKMAAIERILKPAIDEMRNLITQQQDDLIKSGFINDKLIDIVQDSKGNYTTRLYESHRNPDWAGYFEYDKNKNMKGGAAIEAIFNNAEKAILDIVKADLSAALKKVTKYQKAITTFNINYPNPTNEQKSALEKMEQELKEAQADVKELNLILTNPDDLHSHVVNYLKDAYRNSNAILTPDLGKGSEKSAIGKSIFIRRENIPVEIRELLGEIRDPAQVFMATMVKLASFQANSEFQKKWFDINETLMQQYQNAVSQGLKPKIGPIFSTTPMPDAGLTRRVNLTDQMQVLRKELGQNFMYVHEYFADDVFNKAFELPYNIGTAFSLMNTIGKVNVTIADPVTATGNFLSNTTKFASTLLITKNKGEFLSTFGRAIKERMKQEASRIKNVKSGFIPNPYSQSYEDFNHIMQVQGLENSDFNTADLQVDMKNQKRIWDFLDRITDIPIAKEVKNFLKIAMVIPRFYAAGDGVFKEAFFIHEANEYAYANFGMSYNEMKNTKQNPADIKLVEDIAGKIVRDTFQNYNETWEINKMLKETIVGQFFAPFLPFLLEQYRTLWNTVATATTETNDTNPEVRKIGWKRFGGLIAMTAFSSTAFMQVLSASLGDDEEDEKVTEFAKKWKVYPEGVSAEVITIDSDSGMIKTFDYAQRNVAGNLSMLQKIFIDVNMGKSYGEAIGDFLKNTFSPAMQEQLGTEVFLQMKEMKDEYGNDLIQPNDDTETMIKKLAKHFGKFLTPGGIKRLQNIAEKRKEISDMEAVVNDYRRRMQLYPTSEELNRLNQLEAELLKREYDLKEMKEGLSSIRQYNFDPNTQMPQMIYKSVEKIQDLSSEYMRRIQEIGLKKVTNRQRLEIYRDINEMYKKELAILKDYYNDASEVGKNYGWKPERVFEQGVISKNEKQGSNFKKFPTITNSVLKYIYGEESAPDITVKEHNDWLKEQ